MRLTKLFFTGILSSYVFFLNASEQTANTPKPQETSGISQPSKDAKGKDFSFKQFKIPDASRTCDDAFKAFMQKRIPEIDLSNVSDFTTNGDGTIEAAYQKLVETKSFGASSPNLSIVLSNTGVATEFISKWEETFKKDNKTVIWNLSYNKELGDDVIDALSDSLDNVYSLNLEHTSFTDAGIAKLATHIEQNGIGKLKCIFLTSAKVTQQGVDSLRTAIQTAVAAWETKNPGKKYELEGNNGVVFEPTAYLSKATATPKTDDMQTAISAKPETKTEPEINITAIPATTETSLDKD
ncbi:MAG: hypothetical protein LBM19_02345, partial [Holosporales bacterium]|nr:hypothetical protein [Holosporales bacterium]